MNKKIFKTKKGMTLVELVVAMSVLVIVSAGLSTFFITIWEAKSNEVEMGNSLLIVSQTVNKMTTNIRQGGSQADSGAYFIDSADDFDLVFYSDIDNDLHMERVHYYKDGTEIKMGTTEPILGTNPTYPILDETTVVIAKNVTNTVSEPIFTYYDNTYAALVTPASIAPIRLVRVSVSVNTDPTKISDVTISSLTSFRNINN